MEGLIQAIHYYLRDGLYHTAYIITNEELKAGPDPILSFWKAFAIFKDGAVTEAIHELQVIPSKREIQFAIILALEYYNSKPCINFF